jgi:ketosteroid isomerase-like protein
MSRENVEVIERATRHFMETGEPDWGPLDPTIELHDHDTPDQDVYRGHAGVARWLEDWGAAWAEWTIEPEDYIDAGDYVVLVIRLNAKGRRSGAEIDRRDALLYTFRDAKIVRIDYYNSREQALEAVGLRE